MSRRRERASAQGLLPLMEARPWKDGETVTYRYHPLGGKPINLGTDRQAAMLEVLRMNGQAPDSGSITELWRLFQRGADWKALKPATQADYTQCSVELLRVFGAMRPGDLKAQHIRQYLRVERAAAPVRANRETALLSNLLNLAIDRGDVDTNVCRQVRRNKERPRSMAPDGEALHRLIGWARARGGQAAVLAGMAEFAALSGNRRAEFRPLRWPQWTAETVRLQRAKQRDDDAPVFEVVANSPALLELRERMLAVSGADPVGPVFPAARGGAYNERAFKTAWARLIAAALEDEAGPPVLLAGQRFTFHDLRAHYVTEHKRRTGALPDLHRNTATTARVYDRAREVKRRAL